MQEALHHLRFQIIGYGVLLLGFWAWLTWMDYTREDRLHDLSALPEIDSSPQT